MAFRHNKSYFTCFRSPIQAHNFSYAKQEGGRGKKHMASRKNEVRPNLNFKASYLNKTPWNFYDIAYRFFGTKSRLQYEGHKLNRPHSISGNAVCNL